MAKPERYFIGPSMKNKLSGIIDRLDGTPLGGGADEIPVRLSGMQRSGGGGGGGGNSVIEASYTGGWVKGATKEIRFLANTATTAIATNLIRTVPISSGQTARLCTVTLRSDTSGVSAMYILLNSEC